MRSPEECKRIDNIAENFKEHEYYAGSESGGFIIATSKYFKQQIRFKAREMAIEDLKDWIMDKKWDLEGHSDDYINGWNDCVYSLLGEEEE